MDAAPLPVPAEEPPSRDWSLLPFDVLCLVFVRVSAIDVLMGAGLVCRSWLEAAELPDVWRTVDMENHVAVLHKEDDVLRAMAKAAVDRSNGQLRMFVGNSFVTYDLLEYIVERSPSVTSLRLVYCYYALISVPHLLELRSLELDHVKLTVGHLTAVLENCPKLEVLRVRNCFYTGSPSGLALPAKFPRIKTMMLECDDGLFWEQRSCEYHLRSRS